MKIVYNNSRIEKLLKNENKLSKKFGKNISDTILMRIQYLRNADNLNAISPYKPYNRHKLLGNYKEHFAIDVIGGLRIVFKPIDEKENELKKIKEIIIVDVKDYHD